MIRKPLLLVLVLLAAPGCFPIELDVSKDGKLLIPRQEGFFTFDAASGKTLKVWGNEEGQPAFARYSPNGKDFLAVTKSTRAFRNEYSFHLVPLAGGKGREIYRGEDTGYVRFSPDGSLFAVVKASEKEHPVMKDRLPEMFLVNLKDGTSQRLLANVAFLFRWMSDSKRMLVFEITDKDQNGRFSGNLAILDAGTGKQTPLASAAINQQFSLDLHLDNKKALFTGLGAGKPGQKVVVGDQFGAPKLFELDLATGEVKDRERPARYALYSPSGQKVLLGMPPEGFSLNTLKLEVANADFSGAKTIASDAFNPMGLGGDGTTFPGWVDEKTVFYFMERNVYGTSGRSLNLMVTGAEGQKRRCVQPLIDLEVLKDLQ